MKAYNDWAIGKKIFVPLIFISILISSACITVLAVRFLEIKKQAIPAVSVFSGLRQGSLELLNEYHQFVRTPDDGVREDIQETKILLRQYLDELSGLDGNSYFDRKTGVLVEELVKELIGQEDALVAHRLQVSQALSLITSLETELRQAGFIAAQNLNGTRIEGVPWNEKTATNTLLALEHLALCRQFVEESHPGKLVEIEGRARQSRARLGSILPGESLLLGRLVEIDEHGQMAGSALRDDLIVLEELKGEISRMFDQARFELTTQGARRVSLAFLIIAAWIVLLFTALVASTRLLSRTISKPVQALALAANKMGVDGSYDLLPVSSNDEIGSLARSFNHMAKRLQQDKLDQESDAQTLAELNKRLQSREIELIRKTEQAMVASSQATEANLTKSLFLANISHELRTPMNGILGLSEIISELVEDPVLKKYNNAILRSAEGLLVIINDVLDISALDVGKMRLDKTAFLPVDVIEEVVELLASEAAEKSLKLEIRSQPGLQHRFVGDAARIKQVLINLVGNALKFTDEGSVCVEAARQFDSDGQVTLHIKVIDTGQGFSAEDKEHFFERFTQADSSATRRKGGTGLGLSICKQLVELMQGDIGCQSTLGQGATFWFSVPLEEVVVEKDAGTMPG